MHEKLVLILYDSFPRLSHLKRNVRTSNYENNLRQVFDLLASRQDMARDGGGEDDRVEDRFYKGKKIE